MVDWGAGERVQWLRAVSAFGEDPGTVPNTDMVAQLPTTSIPSFALLRAPCGTHIYM